MYILVNDEINNIKRNLQSRKRSTRFQILLISYCNFYCCCWCQSCPCFVSSAASFCKQFIIGSSADIVEAVVHSGAVVVKSLAFVVWAGVVVESEVAVV